MRLPLVLTGLAACVQPAPHATVVIAGAPASHAVLVLPTSCTSLAYPELCTPATYDSEPTVGPPMLPSFADYVDPALRLKLELAGFTLAEGGAMRVVTAERVDTDGASQVLAGDGAAMVADLPLADVFAVARSLELAGVVVPRLTLHPAGFARYRAELVVTLLDVATQQPRWTVTCSEPMLDPVAVPNRLGNCAGNGVLAALAPANVIGEAL